MIFHYDQEGDVLDISVGKPRAAVSTEVEDDFFVRRLPGKGQIIGFSLLNFTKSFRGKNKHRIVPVQGYFKSL